MDRRFSLFLGLGVALFGASAGCTPSFFNSRKSDSPPQTTESQKQAVETPVASARDIVHKEKELPKRQPKAMSCVAAGDFFYREAVTPDRSPEDRHERLDTAKRAYQQALQLDPNCSEAHRGLARVYGTDEDNERAVASFQAALRGAPKDANLWFELGVHHSRHKQWDAAIEALARAVELCPEEKQYAKVLAACLGCAGRYEESLGCFTRVVGEAKARNYLGRLMISLGQTEQGRQQLQLSLGMEPNNAETRQRLANLDRAKKQPESVVPVDYREPKR